MHSDAHIVLTVEAGCTPENTLVIKKEAEPIASCKVAEIYSRVREKNLPLGCCHFNQRKSQIAFLHTLVVNEDGMLYLYVNRSFKH